MSFVALLRPACARAMGVRMCDCENERRAKKAVFELKLMRGSGVIDLVKLEEILDPVRDKA